MSAADPLISAEGLEVRYHGGPEPAVRDLTFRLGPGDGLLLSGPAGSGKTSALRGLLGLVDRIGDIALAGAVGYGPEGEGFAPGLTVREAVRAVAAQRPRPPSGAGVDAALERAGLGFVDGWRTARLDAEGWRRLSLALAIAGDPPIVVLDDPWMLRDAAREMAAARGRGAAVLAASRTPAGLAPILGRRMALREGVPA